MNYVHVVSLFYVNLVKFYGKGEAKSGKSLFFSSSLGKSVFNV